jgi:indole-3-glycerol phosphate synthase
MNNRLTEIINQKHLEVFELQKILDKHPEHIINALLTGKLVKPINKNFKEALSGDTLAVIAEIKRRSPSKGDLAPISDPVALAQQYVQGNVNAISVLTDKLFFSGSTEDLQQVSAALADEPVPVLRKDFIIDRLQIAEAVSIGAHAVLLIVAALGARTAELLTICQELGLHALVEVHDEAELETALHCGAQIIGVNNRNLTTFAIDTDQAFRLAEKIPANLIKVAESGIMEPKLAREYHAAGFNAVLIGEALVKANDPAEFIRNCKI